MKGYSIGIALEAGPNAPIILRGAYPSCFERAKVYGYDAVEIHSSDPAQIDVPLLKALCERYDLKISTLTTGANYVARGVDLTHTSAAERQRAVDCMKTYIDLGAMLEADVIIGLLHGMQGNRTEAEYQTLLLESMTPIVQYAQERETLLVFEAINRFEVDSYHRCEECLTLVKHFDSPWLKVHLDAFHMNIEETSMEGAIALAGSDLGHFHLADSNRRAPGEGHIDFTAVLDALDEVGYNGYLTTEHIPYPDPDTAAHNAIQHLKSLKGS